MLGAVEIALGVHKRLKRRLGTGSTNNPEIAVNLIWIRQLLHIRRVVGRPQRWEHPRNHIATNATELGDKARRGRPTEAVVVSDNRRRVPTQLVVENVTDTSVPLCTVAVEPEEVRRLNMHRRLLRPGNAVQERNLRMVLGVVRDSNRLITRKWADHHIGAVLLHDLANLLNCTIRCVVTTTNRNQLDRHTGN